MLEEQQGALGLLLLGSTSWSVGRLVGRSVVVGFPCLFVRSSVRSVRLFRSVGSLPPLLLVSFWSSALSSLLRSSVRLKSWMEFLLFAFSVTAGKSRPYRIYVQFARPDPSFGDGLSNVGPTR